MIVSHRHRFIYFPDPLDGSPALSAGFAPFGDALVLPENGRDAASSFHTGMSPQEAAWAFDATGLAFRSYLRIAVVQNPFIRLVRLYHKIAQTDPLWRARKRAGLGRKEFPRWLKNTRAHGWGAGNRTSPRWRRFGAWSAEHWCGSHISHAIRQECIEPDLTAILSLIGVAPGFDDDFTHASVADSWPSYYTPNAIDIVRRRYGWDLDAYGYDDFHQKAAS